MDYNPARHHQKIIDAGGTTRGSLMTWRATRPLFGEFIHAIGHFEGFSPYLYGAIGPGFQRGDKDSPILRDYIRAPGLVLLDQHENQLWLDGCAIGFGGEGPTGTAYILVKEGFSEDHVNRYVPHCSRLHLAKGEPEPIVADFKSGHAGPRPVHPGRRRPRAMSDHIRDLEAQGYFDDVAVEEH